MAAVERKQPKEGTLSDFKDCFREMLCKVPEGEDWKDCCYLLECDHCPKKDFILRKLRRLLDEALIDTVTYNSWMKVEGRFYLQTLVKPAEEFLEVFVKALTDLLPHHLVTKRQSHHFQKVKNNLKPGEVCVISDFAENYSCIMQNEIQGYHWNNEQVTLHPFVAYYKPEEGDPKVISYVALSDHLKHSTATFYAYQTKFIKHLKEELSKQGITLTKIHYFSDGARSQYKNKFNLKNMLHHAEDFGVKIEWHYFASCHGKGACDGVGGLVKRCAAKASLQGKLIRNAEEMHKWASDKMTTIVTELSTKEEVESVIVQQQTRFKQAQALPGISLIHAVLPQSTSSALVKRFSLSDSATLKTFDIQPSTREKVPWETLLGYVTVARSDSDKWWLAKIDSKNEECKTLDITFLHPAGRARSYRFQQVPDKGVIPWNDALTNVVPTIKKVHTLSQQEKILADKELKLYKNGGQDGGEDAYGWGMRQVQVGLLFGALSMAYVFRINLSICLVEMTDMNSTRTDVVFYDWNASERGLILSSFFWGYIVTQVPAGILAVRYGPKWFLFVGVVACSVLSALTPLAAQWGGWQLVLAWRVMQGLVQGFIYPSSHAMLSRWVPPLERGRATAIVYNGISVGTVASMAGAGALSASPLGWPSGFWVPGVIGLVWGAAWVLLAADAPSTCKRISPAERAYIERAFGDTSSGQKKHPVPWKAIMTSLPMWALIIVHSGQNFGHWTLLTEMPAYMKQVLGFDIEANAVYSSLPYICLTISSLFVSWFGKVVNENGWLSLNVSRKTFQSVAHWGSGATMLVLGLVNVSSTMAIVLLCVAVAFEAGTLTGYLCNHMDMSPNFGGAMMGVTNCLAAVVAIIAPLLVAAITGDSEKLTLEETTMRWNIVFILAAGVYFVGNLLWVLFGSTDVQPWNTPKQDEEEGLHSGSGDTTATVEEHCK